MVVEHATLEDAVANGIDLSTNAFMLIHGWTAGPFLLEFVSSCAEPLRSAEGPLSASALADKVGANPGPLGIVLRTCCALGYLDVDASGGFSLVAGPELDELLSLLAENTPAASALRELYKEAQPPFRLPSKPASLCLRVWAQERPRWTSSKSKALSILLDGAVLAPLLTSIAYFARWDETGLDRGQPPHHDRLPLASAASSDAGAGAGGAGAGAPAPAPALSAEERGLLRSIVEELGIGSVDDEDTLSLTSRGSLALQRCFSFFVPTSYAPLLSKLEHILRQDAGWGFVDAGQDVGETEEHVHRILNVVGSGAQHRTLFKDLTRHIHSIFDSEDFEAQPKFVIDTGCGDGHLLAHIYEHVREHTARGQRLEDFPLTMVGVDFNEESRMATALNLSAKDVPHKVIAGDIGKPSGIIAALKRKKVDAKRALHVRSFLDHDRPYIAPTRLPGDASAAARFAAAELADFVHLDKQGRPISAVEVFASLVEHFERWSDAINGSFGLCLLEVMMLDLPTTRRFLNDCVSLHFDIVQCLSRQYMLSAPAFAMGAAMAGLLPADVRKVQTYPEQGRYCRVVNQHLLRKEFKIRFAEPSDLDDLVRLEELTWAECLRASREVLARRLEVSPTTVLVCEKDSKPIAVLYMQKVASEASVDAEKFMEISDAHDPAGRVLQLVAIGSDPAVAGLGIGSQLRNFALHLARLDPTVDCVIGVTRCSAFTGAPEDLQKYVDRHLAGEVVDQTLNFHTGFGASVVRLVPDFRPEDTANGSIGVLVRYSVKEWVSESWTKATSTTSAAPKERSISGVNGKAHGEKAAATTTLDTIASVMSELGHHLDRGDLGKGFMEYGFDSVELVHLKNKLEQVLQLDLPATLMLDFPNVMELSADLDRRRCATGAASASKASAEVVAEALAELGREVDEEDLGKGFFNYGLDSLELGRLRQKLAARLRLELPATLLLDFPSVADLAVELDRRRNEAGISSSSSVDLVSSILRELGHGVDGGDLAKSFFNYGMDSLELVRIKEKLSRALSLELPSTLLLDFPSVASLAPELDRRRRQGENGNSGNGDAARAKGPWDSVGVKDLVPLLERCTKKYGLPQYQRRFSELFEKHRGDKAKYLDSVEPVFIEVEGSVMAAFDLVEDQSLARVRAARKDFAAALRKFSTIKDVRTLSEELARLTKQDGASWS